MKDFTDRVALITGGSTGIGLALGMKLAGLGARVALVARSEDKLRAAVTAIERSHGSGRAFAFPCDVSNLNVLDALEQRVRDELGPVELLVNNAGASQRGSILDRTAVELASVMNTNLVGPLVLTRVVAAHMRPGAAVVNVASLAGMVPLHEEPVYSASKAGLRFLARAIAPDLASRGIQTLTVCPGPVDTGFIADVSAVSEIVLSQPMRTADEVADAILLGLRRRRLEMAIPARAGVLVTLAYLFPRLERLLRPIVWRIGSVAKRRYAAAVASRRCSGEPVRLPSS